MSATPAIRLCAEAFGTFCLVFAGTGAVVVNEVTGGGVRNEDSLTRPGSGFGERVNKKSGCNSS